MGCQDQQYISFFPHYVRPCESGSPARPGDIWALATMCSTGLQSEPSGQRPLSENKMLSLLEHFVFHFTSTSEISVKNVTFPSMDQGCFHGNTSNSHELQFYVNWLLMEDKTKASRENWESLVPWSAESGGRGLSVSYARILMFSGPWGCWTRNHFMHTTSQSLWAKTDFKSHLEPLVLKPHKLSPRMGKNWMKITGW